MRGHGSRWNRPLRALWIVPVCLAAFVAGALVPAVTSGAQQAPGWTLSLTATKTVEGEGLAAFIAKYPSFRSVLDDEIYSITATCTASGTAPAGTVHGAETSAIDLAASGSEGSATVVLGAGKQTTIPITVEDATGVDDVGCTVTEAIALAMPGCAAGASCAYVVCDAPEYRPARNVEFNADGESATVEVVNRCRGVENMSSPPPPTSPPTSPIDTSPTFTG